MLNCPGNSPERKKPEDMVSYVGCTNCGYNVELWFDENKKKCPNCKEYVFKNQEDLLKDFKCANWCDPNNAERCLGPKTYQRFKELKKIQKGKESIEDLV